MIVAADKHFSESLFLPILFGIFIIFDATSAGGHELLSTPVRVVTTSENDIFPEAWRTHPINATGEVLADSDFERASRVLKRAFAKYSESTLTKNLKVVYVLSELEYSGVATGGTNSRTAVYVKVGDVKNGYTDTAIENAFHAEFSSILLRNRIADFDADTWRKLNPPDFEYSVGDGVGAIREGKASLQPDDMLHEQGFRNQYAQSSLENDFNGYAAALLCGDKQVWELAQKYTKIKGKLELTIAFYQAIDPAMTEKLLSSLVTH